MLPKNRVLTSINHELPDRVPVFLIGLEQENINMFLHSLDLKSSEQIMNFLGIDVRTVRPVYKQSEIVKSLGKEFANIKTVAGKPETFGIPNKRSLSDQLITRPFANTTSIKEVENYPYWPNPEAFDFEVVNRYVEQTEGKYAISRGFMPVFTGYLELTGIEAGLLNLYINPDIVEVILEILTNIYVKHLEKMIEVSGQYLDFAPLGDDFATQKGLMISPKHWRKFLKPHYKRIFETVKSKGLNVWFHACGSFREVLPDLVDIGLDVWETVQLHVKGNDPYELKKEFGNHITFAGGINTQKTLPFGTSEEVRQEVRDVISILGKGGGYICGPDHTLMPEVPLENVLALYDEARNFCQYGITR